MIREFTSPLSAFFMLTMGMAYGEPKWYRILYCYSSIASYLTFPVITVYLIYIVVKRLHERVVLKKSTMKSPSDMPTDTNTPTSSPCLMDER